MLLRSEVFNNGKSMKYLIDSFNRILRMGTDNPRINLALVQRIKVANVIALIGACNHIIILPLIFFYITMI